MINVFIFNPLGLENGRGGEISAIELASGLKKFYNITLMDTNILIGKRLLSQKVIQKKLKEVKRDKQMKFAIFKILNKTFTFPYPWEIPKLSREIKKSDIVYTSSFTIKFDLLLIFLSLIHRRTKFIIGFRKPLFSEKLFSFYNLKFRISILLFSLLKKRFYFHTISYHAKKFLETFFEKEKVIHIVHGVELERFLERGTENRREDVLSFIYVGYLDDTHKGVGVLLDGIEEFIGEHKDLSLFFEFCGAGPLEHRLTKLQEKFPNLVKYQGYINNDRISDYYKRNDVFLFTSRREPFGRVIVEALASNLLIICTKTFGSMEILKGKKFAFFLSELKSDIIKDKIFSLYKLWQEKNEYFKSLQESAKIYALDNYTYSKELEMFKELIHKLKFNN